jgi:hypothetical protein
VRRYLPWLLPALCAAALAPPADGDSWLFITAGHSFLSHDWSRAFANPSIQAGPLQLALFGGLGHWVGFVIAPVLALLVVTASRAAGIRNPQVLVLAGLVSILTGLTSSGIDSGHPANALLPLLWIIAGSQARRGKVLGPAVIVGLSAGVETWGILGVAVLALSPRLRAAALSVAIAACIAAATYAPFVIAGQFNMGAYKWVVMNDSFLSYFVDPGTAIGWPLRIAQGALALSAGLALAYFGGRRSRHLLWLVPCVVVLVRILLDPHGSGYYTVGVEGPAIVGLTLISTWSMQLPRFRRETFA